MPLWGFFHNTLEFVTSKFAKAGKPFSEAYTVFKDIVRAKEPRRQYQRWREKVIAKRVRPFLEAAPGWMPVAEVYVTPTPAILKEKFQYIFDVGFKFKGVPLEERQFFSILSSEYLTKKQAEGRMREVILENEQRGKYQELENLDLKMAEVRTSLLDA